MFKSTNLAKLGETRLNLCCSTICQNTADTTIWRYKQTMFSTKLILNIHWLQGADLTRFGTWPRFSKLLSVCQIRSTKPLHPVRKGALPIMKKRP